jgi:beta-galactosidase
VLLLAACGGMNVAFAAATNFRIVASLNPDWRLFVGDPSGAEASSFDATHWKTVSLPHAWNEDSAFKVAIDQIPTGIAWYRKEFRLPPNTGGQKIFVEFERARQSAEVWINGHFLGRHENGITAFGFDVTEWVKPAPASNVLAVRTDNSWDYTEKDTGTRFQWNDKNFNVPYGGLIGNVRLHVTGKLYQTLPLFSSFGTTGTYVYADAIETARRSATLHVESELRNEFAEPRTVVLAVEVRDGGGKIVAAFRGEPRQVAAGATIIASAAQRIDGLNFWSWGYGYLYDVKSTLLVQGRPVDTVTTRTGFRATQFAHGMLTLNGRAIHLKGYGQRTTNEWPALGSAVPPWLSDYSNRLMVESGANLVRWMHVTPWRQDVESCDRVGLIEAMPAGDSESDATGRQWQQRVEVMRDSIVYNRNSPSILFYEGGNKGINEDHMRELESLRDRYDPHGGRAAGAREMLGSAVAEYGGEMLYINKSAGIPLWQMEYSRDEGLRKYWDELSPPFHKDGDGPPYRGQPAAAYNRNQDSHAIEDIRRWYDYWAERPGTGTRVNAGGVNIIFSDSNTHFRGAESYRRSGEVDAMRIPKDGYWAHQVMWNGWVDVEKPGIHILGHWNYRAGVTKDVYVVASTPAVELFLNGRSLGQGVRSSHFLFTFKDVAWQSGELRAVGSDLSGRALAEFTEVTAGEPAALRLTEVARPHELLADGADVALVEVEVVDANGRRCPTALNPVDFEVTGPAEFRGGIAQGPDNYILSHSLPVEGGVNRVLIRSRRDAGRIVLTARSGSLRPARIEFTSQAVDIAGGLSSLPSAASLPLNLSRGPTPSGDSFVVSRVAVPVAAATAPGDGHPAFAVDDNEATLWSGKGPIKFELARAARLCEITAKFAGFRARSYPIRIAVDGHEVYRGVTPRSLGYVTLPLNPVTGNAVTIEVMGAEQAKEAFGDIVELQAQGRATTGEEQVGPGELGIVEIEFYEPAAASRCGER